jgi:hypothetical protein
MEFTSGLGDATKHVILGHLKGTVVEYEAMQNQRTQLKTVKFCECKA